MKFSLPLFLLSALGVTSLHAQAPATSAEQAKKVLEQAHKKTEAAAAATKPTAPATAPAGQNFSNVPVPPPKVIDKAAPPKSSGDMTIDSNTLFLNKDSSKGIFRGKVRLRSASMDIDCEELEIWFKEGALAGDDATPAPAPEKPATPDKPAAPFDPNKPNAPADPIDKPAAAPPQDLNSDKIEKAWARGLGSTVTIVKRGGKTSVCKCGEAFFDKNTGNLIMKIWPEAEQDGTRIQATERGTILTLDKNGKLNGEGPTKVIRGTADTKPASSTTPAPSPTPTPAKPR